MVIRLQSKKQKEKRHILLPRAQGQSRKIRHKDMTDQISVHGLFTLSNESCVITDCTAPCMRNTMLSRQMSVTSRWLVPEQQNKQGAGGETITITAAMMASSRAVSGVVIPRHLRERGKIMDDA
ncbi:Uncharacterized protein DAT39_022291 [Clarias magur]|uniref:Uncharacterized protein n=1 Tax=Clarias magur TaxID=1594786 RepID=A0A8J4T402_CLAMG|nr:Uncharacterized protein DAT39_022291 [Clarias magur]